MILPECLWQFALSVCAAMLRSVSATLVLENYGMCGLHTFEGEVPMVTVVVVVSQVVFGKNPSPPQSLLQVKEYNLRGAICFFTELLP